MSYIGININWLCILLGKLCGKPSCLLLAEAGSSGWLLRIRQAAEGQCVETWTKLRALNYKPLHSFKDRKQRMTKVYTKHSYPFTVFGWCHFWERQLASHSPVVGFNLQAPLSYGVGGDHSWSWFSRTDCPWWGGVLLLSITNLDINQICPSRQYV